MEAGKGVRRMMGYGLPAAKGMMSGGWWGAYYGLGLVSWVVLIVLGVAAIRYLWKKAGK